MVAIPRQLFATVLSFLLAVPAFSNSYNANGNTTASGQTGYVYDFENHLISANGITYVYDGDGHRVSKTEQPRPMPRRTSIRPAIRK
jgi:hypothetical protein